ncbi:MULTISPECIES: MurR/RpiR family transcriptional regulator [Microbacterium]|uniref:MurR/RpiR family transcriptional regulator n=1 Tax=Microbacterium TaxID=33882 RepID=UPI0021A8B787|nr:MULTISPECIES: SIS domain-containing protein [Microbacterium]MCT1365676.1 SIS domain-containing protein [Microbacterium sp. p3-SID131]MCT1377824.1 SIS domain-containing protein [Microbacterium sp. p3-SID337]MCZ0710729.1 SIS domain-containing protein [Microbacterium paraoxydans]MDH5131584.1 SIS domain-containing protein [Microbacterium sp. RD10]MDH5135137.1 SIS domain-containing protein [Microbacterium sp. RD11]
MNDHDHDQEDRDLVSPRDRYGERIRTNLSAESIQARIIETEQRTLAQTFEELSRSAQVPQAAALLLGARRRYVAGEGKAAAYAQLLNADLSATLSNVFLVDGHALQPLTVLTDVRASDVLIAFSLRRYREETVRLGRLFHEAGGQLVVITDSEDAPLASIATSLIRVRTGSASYADSPTPVAAVCHLLSALTTASAKGARRRLAERDRLVARLGLYGPETPRPRTEEDA